MFVRPLFQSGGLVDPNQGFGSVLPADPLGFLPPPSLADVSASPLSPNYVPSAYQPTPSWLERQSIQHELDVQIPDLSPRDVFTRDPEEASDIGAGFAGTTRHSADDQSPRVP